MENKGEYKYIEVNKLIDAKPELFSLPSNIVVPVTFISALTGMFAISFGWGLWLGFFAILLFNGLYFFLFGREWWRMVVKFQNPPNWTRKDVRAIEFTLDPNKYEAEAKRRKNSRKRKKRERPN